MLVIFIISISIGLPYMCYQHDKNELNELTKRLVDFNERLETYKQNLEDAKASKKKFIEKLRRSGIWVTEIEYNPNFPNSTGKVEASSYDFDTNFLKDICYQINQRNKEIYRIEKDIKELEEEIKIEKNEQKIQELKERIQNWNTFCDKIKFFKVKNVHEFSKCYLGSDF